MARSKYLLAGAALVTAFAVGRYTVPEKIVVKTVEVEKKTDTTKTDLERDKRKETTVVEETAPDGTKKKTTKTVEDTRTQKKTDATETVDTTKSTEKEITGATQKTSILALLGVPLSLSDPVRPIYGASVTRPVLGPITIGVWALTSPAAGVSLGITF